MFLVGGFNHCAKCQSTGMIVFNIWKNMFQTTNQVSFARYFETENATLDARLCVSRQQRVCSWNQLESALCTGLHAECFRIVEQTYAICVGFATFWNLLCGLLRFLRFWICLLAVYDLFAVGLGVYLQVVVSRIGLRIIQDYFRVGLEFLQVRLLQCVLKIVLGLYNLLNDPW